jgi:hypothetical protein
MSETGALKHIIQINDLRSNLEQGLTGAGLTELKANQIAIALGTTGPSPVYRLLFRDSVGGPHDVANLTDIGAGPAGATGVLGSTGLKGATGAQGVTGLSGVGGGGGVTGSGVSTQVAVWTANGSIGGFNGFIYTGGSYSPILSLVNGETGGTTVLNFVDEDSQISSEGSFDLNSGGDFNYSTTDPTGNFNITLDPEGTGSFYLHCQVASFSLSPSGGAGSYTLNFSAGTTLVAKFEGGSGLDQVWSAGANNDNLIIASGGSFELQANSNIFLRASYSVEEGVYNDSNLYIMNFIGSSFSPPSADVAGSIQMSAVGDLNIFSGLGADDERTINMYCYTSGGSTIKLLTLSPNFNGSGTVFIYSLPSDSGGLTTGALYNSSGTLKIKS